MICKNKLACKVYLLAWNTDWKMEENNENVISTLTAVDEIHPCHGFNVTSYDSSTTFSIFFSGSFNSICNNNEVKSRVLQNM